MGTALALARLDVASSLARLATEQVSLHMLSFEAGVFLLAPSISAYLWTS